MISKSPIDNAEQPGGPAPWLFSIWGLVTALWFAFAFAPAESQGQSWLKIAQAVCFGTLESGLPSAWGWVVMFLAPLSMLAGLIASFANDLVGWAKARRGLAGLGILILSGVFIVEGGWMASRLRNAREIFSAFETAPEKEPLPENYPRLAEALPPFTLIDQHGQNVSAHDLAGSATVLCFIYASCATVCPFLIRDTLQAVKPVDGARAAFLTLDPWRDTPGALAGIARRYGLGAESSILTGNPEKVVALLKKLGIESLRDPLSGEIQHPPLVLVLDRKGRIAYRFNRPPVSWLRTALQRVQKEN